MNLKIKLLKLLPLITFITLLFPTAKVVKAATSVAQKESVELEKIITQESDGVKYAAAPKGDKGYGEAKSAKKIVLSEKAAQVEFIIFGSLIGLGILVPEILFRGKKNKKSSNNQQNELANKKPEKTVEPDLEFLKAISEKTKEAQKSSQYNGKVETQANSKSA